MLISDEELFKTNKGSTKIKFTDLTKNNASSNQDLINQSNQFVPNAPFFYCLKPSENRKVFCCFQGVEKGALGKNGLKEVWRTLYLEQFQATTTSPASFHL